MIVLGLLVLLAAGGLAVSGITTRDSAAHPRAHFPARSGLLGYHLPGPGSRLFFFGLVLAAAAMSGLAKVAAGLAGTASTEDLRQAMVCYRALFGDLLGEPADTGSGTAAAAADTSGQLTESDPKEMAK